jgi:hypothetical protein
MRTYQPLLVVLLLNLAGGYTSTAHADVVMDFENLANPSNGFATPQGSIVTQNGFTLNSNDSDGFYTVAPDGGLSGLNYTGSVAAAPADYPNISTLTQTDGDPFSLHSIDMANLFQQSNTPGKEVVIVTGNLVGGGTVTQYCVVEDNDSLQHFTFPSTFSHLSSVSLWEEQASSGVQYDNLVLRPSSVPEPGVCATLSGFGLTGGLILYRRRRLVGR